MILRGAIETRLGKVAGGGAGRVPRLAAIAFALTLGWTTYAGSSLASESEHGSGGGKEKAEEEVSLPDAAPPELTPAEQYCSAIVDAAAAAQIAQQKANLEKAQKELDKRVELVVVKTEELKAWIKRREDFTRQATEQLVQIYGKMKPDAAATQLVIMNELVAAAILSKLQPKSTSLILAEMEASRAARLSAVIAGAGEIVGKPKQVSDAH